ncbi:hypothetical protein [Serpentinicella alkaliphila]|uniref:DUF3953 domain-containing protein n=1 Tax=Serpentinicella alkaliphila TaxID=1734049 RepID=A0A4R2T284_9FIRM|nr:hypothetical protein [Serpentinicella alkaliphila]QUH26511.1 hypothetical protein HZR23_12805 [Serpentinicella alkaliphila]TCP95491.1 hypothetical protein EDD79_10596 [Serpentinicella alkaliphila]
MLKIIGGILSVIVIGLGGYSIFTKDYQFMTYLMFFLGSSLVISALLEFKKNKKSARGYFNIGLSVIVFVLFLQKIFTN